MSDRNGSLLERLAEETSALAARAADAVVQVHGRPGRPASAVVVGAGRVLTTHHSVEADDRVGVVAGSGRLQARVVGRDPGSDLALLAVDGLDAPPLAVASAEPAAGALAVVAGRAWSGDLRARLVTVTGHAASRAFAHRGLERALGLALTPYPGFSGSAVLAADGTLAGLATTGLVRGSCFAVPAPELTRIVAALEEHGGVPRAYLGVSTQAVHIPERQRAGRSQNVGLLVVGVGAGTPADAAGLLVGDVIVGFAGEAVRDPDALLSRLTGERIGTNVPLDVLRGGAEHEVAVTVGRRPVAR